MRNLVKSASKYAEGVEKMANYGVTTKRTTDRCAASSENRECKQKPQKSEVQAQLEAAYNIQIKRVATTVVLRNPAQEDDLYEIHSMACRYDACAWHWVSG